MLRIAALALALVAIVLAPLGSAGAVGVPAAAQVGDCASVRDAPDGTVDHTHMGTAKAAADGHCLHAACPMALIGGTPGETPRPARRGGLEPPADARLHGLIVPPPRHPPRG